MDKTPNKTTNTRNTGNTGDFANTPHMADRSSDRSTGSDVGMDSSETTGNMSLGGISSKLSGSSLGDARNAIMEQARPAVDYVRNGLRPMMDNSQHYITNARGVITSHPFYAIAGAAAIGVFVGMMFSRSSSRSV